LQEAPDPNGPWTDVAGQVVNSPFVTAMSGATRYFRLRK
jgi:hypothetical protein